MHPNFELSISGEVSDLLASTRILNQTLDLFPRGKKKGVDAHYVIWIVYVIDVL